ncbi:MAG: hypothetical protein M1832_005063 [Thelocarpon impressellum]|nr:MAG: hypothetical protein M1832_005063 [Thelocarpon impressellum]
MLSYDERRQVHGSMPKSRRAMKSLKNVNGALQPKVHRHIWIITGPAGCGKTTVAKHLADNLNLPYVEGDEFHTQSNIKKMAAGIPLTDSDRWDWLVVLRQNAVERLTSAGSSGVVLTCSALKRKYRDVIRIAAYNDHDVEVHFVYLRADEGVLMQRVKARQGHYMKDSMVHSQFKSLEEPYEDETDCLELDVSGSVSAVQRDALGIVQDVLGDDVRRD